MTSDFQTGSTLDDQEQLIESLQARVEALERQEMEYKEAALALLEQTRRNEVVFQSSMDGLCLINPDGRLRKANPAFCKMLGRTRESLIGMNLGSLEIRDNGADESLHAKLKRLHDHDGAQLTASLERADGEAIDVEISANYHRYGHDAFIFAFVRDVTESRKAQRLARRRETILKEVARSAEHFIRAPEWEQDIDSILERLGRAAEVDRVYIFKNTRTDGGINASLIHEWTEEGIEAQINNPALKNSSFSQGFSRWEELMSRGEVVVGVIMEFPTSERDILLAQGIQSLLAAPIFCGEQWWGLIGFDTCRRRRSFFVEEVEILKTIASSIGAAIKREQDAHALRESEQLFRMVTNAAQDGIAVQEWDGERRRVILCNDHYAKISGYSREELLAAENIEDLIKGTDFLGDEESARERIVRGEAIQGQTSWRRPDGKENVCEFTCAPFGTEMPLRLVIISRDVTERRRNDELFRIQRDLALALASESELEPALELCLKAARAASGMDHGGIYIRNTANGALELRCHQNLSDQYVRAVGSLGPESGQAQIVNKGEPVYTRLDRLSLHQSRELIDEGLQALAAVPIHHGDQVVACVCMASKEQAEVSEKARNALEMIASQIGNVVGRIRAQEALKRSEERLKSIIETHHDMIFETDGEGRFTFVSPACQDVLGRAPEELIGRDARGFMTAGAVEAFDRALARNRDGSGAPAWESNWILEGGSTCPMETRIHMVADEDRRFTGIRGNLANISERKRMEREKQRLELQLRHSQKMEAIGSLAGGIAHDFNNILHAIVGFTKMTLRKVEEGSTEAENLRQIFDATQRGAELVRQILTFSRQEKEKRIPVRPAEIIEESIRMLRATVPPTIEIKTRFR